MWNEILGVHLLIQFAEPKAEQLGIVKHNSKHAVKIWNSYVKDKKNGTIIQVSNKNLNEERAITNSLMCCQTYAFQVDYFNGKSVNNKGTKWKLILLIEFNVQLPLRKRKNFSNWSFFVCNILCIRNIPIKEIMFWVHEEAWQLSFFAGGKTFSIYLTSLISNIFICSLHKSLKL